LIQVPPAGINGAVIIPSGVLSIGNNAFRGCTKLTNVTIPTSVESVGGYAFKGCINLTGLNLPTGVTSVGGFAFDDWTSSQTIIIMGHANQALADAAWETYWRGSCDANIVYQGS